MWKNRQKYIKKEVSRTSPVKHKKYDFDMCMLDQSFSRIRIDDGSSYQSLEMPISVAQTSQTRHYKSVILEEVYEDSKDKVDTGSMSGFSRNSSFENLRLEQDKENNG